MAATAKLTRIHAFIAVSGILSVLEKYAIQEFRNVNNRLWVLKLEIRINSMYKMINEPTNSKVYFDKQMGNSDLYSRVSGLPRS